MLKKYLTKTLVISMMFMVSGCSLAENNYRAANLAIENIVDKDETEDWQNKSIENNVDITPVNFYIEDIIEMNQLNLDDSGGNDDKLYAARYYIEGNEICFTLVQVTLESGYTITIKYDGNNFFNIYVGDIKNIGKDCIVIELNSITSTFNSTDVHVLEVVKPTNAMPELIEILTIMDGYDGTDMTSSNYSASKAAFYKGTLFHIPNPILESIEEQRYPQTVIPGVSIVNYEHINYLRVSVRYHGGYKNEDVYVDIFWDGASWCIHDYDNVINDEIE